MTQSGSKPKAPGDTLEIKLELEEPPALDSPMESVGQLGGGSGGSMFEDESFRAALSKLPVVETFLNLVTKDQSFQDFLREALLVVMRVVKSEAGSILELDQKKKLLFFRAVAGQSSDRVSGFLIPIGKGIVGHVAESRQPMVVNSVESNAVYLKQVGDAVGFEARDLICVPIIVRGQVFGVLELLNRVGEKGYSDADLELLNYCSEKMAKAIEARLILGWALAGKQEKKAA